MECVWLRLLVRCAGHAWASSSSLHSQMTDLFRIDTITKTKKHCLSILLICHYIQYSIYLVKRSNLECLNLVSRFLSTTREIEILRHFSRHEFTPMRLTGIGPERVGSNSFDIFKFRNNIIIICEWREYVIIFIWHDNMEKVIKTNAPEATYVYVKLICMHINCFLISLEKFDGVVPLSLYWVVS